MHVQAVGSRMRSAQSLTQAAPATSHACFVVFAIIRACHASVECSGSTQRLPARSAVENLWTRAYARVKHSKAANTGVVKVLGFIASLTQMA